MVQYYEVDQAEVRIEKVQAAIRMLAYSLKKLKLPRAHIRWFVKADNPLGFKLGEAFYDEHDILGKATTRGLMSNEGCEVWIKADMPTRETVETVAHEVLHVMQFYTLPIDKYSEIDVEKLADEFAADVASEEYMKDNESYLDYLTGKDFSEGKYKTVEQILNGKKR